MRPTILPVFLAAGCASAPGPATDALALHSDGPCTVQVDAIDTSTWQQVRGPGMVFCVPDDWRPGGPRSWIGSDGSVGWNPGRLAAFTSDVEVGQPLEPPPNTYGKREHFTESIGGVVVRMWRTEVGTRNVIGGQWIDRNIMYMTVSGRNAAALDRHIDILRTVRISSGEPAQ